MIRIGPSGIGGVKEAEKVLEYYAKSNIKAAEVPFTYGVFLKEKDATRIGKKAKELNINLSVHAPYWINLNSSEKLKVKQSKQRILEAGLIGEKLEASHLVFHAGFYGKISKEETYENIKNAILELKEKLNIKLAPETIGKINVFGSTAEILKLVKETKCSFCLDFAHVVARNQGEISYQDILNPFKDFKHIHAHFSGIEFSSKGERNHKKTPETEIKKLLDVVKKSKVDITIINESPDDVNDALRMIKYLN